MFHRASAKINAITTTRLGKSWGHVLRDKIQQTASTLHPFLRFVVPNFRAAHYVYILFMAFLGSVIVYPISNIRYIDVLFLMSGAATQAGLNTVNLNELRLSQQILVYLFTTACTPIFIHSSLLFIRLYWFERHFDNVKEQSKLNYKMRKSATLAAMSANASTRANTISNQELGFRRHDPDARGRGVYNRQNVQSGHDNVHGNVHGNVHDSDHSSGDISGDHISGDHNVHDSEPGPGSGPVPVSHHVSNDEDPLSSTPANPPQHDGIRFSKNLPHPLKRRTLVEPSDMYKSIAMLQNKHTRRSSTADEEVLVIKSPKEIERDQNTPIFTRKAQKVRQFSMSPRKNISKLQSKSGPWASLKRTISGGSANRRSRALSDGAGSLDDRASIDSEKHDYRDHARKNNRFLRTALASGNASAHSGGSDEISDISDNSGISDDVPVDLEDDDTASADDDDNFSVNSNAIADLDDDTDLKLDETHNKRQEHHEGENDQADLTFIEPDERKTTFSEPKRMPKPTRRKRRRSAIRRWRTPLLKATRSSSFLHASSATRRENDSDDSDDYYTDDEEGNDSMSRASTDNGLSKVMSTNYLSWVPTVGKNSAFMHLNEEQKEELGGVEYRAIKLLIKILVVYYFGFHVIALCMFVGYISVDGAKALEMRDFGISPAWWGLFTAQSVFNDLGLTLTPNSMSSYNKSVYVLIVSSFFIVIGNTGFPVFLRFIIWLLFKLSRPLSLYKESLGFLLDHPRRCFTMLFPSIPTWWLFSILVVLNAVDLILFVILDFNSDYLSSTPRGYRVLDGLFQAFSTRTAGFSCLTVANLHPAVQVSYMIMMYISVLPLAISIRRTNVYEEQSLGIYLANNGDDQDDPDATTKNFIGTHLRNQLSFDLWFIFLGLFIICCAEGGKIKSNEAGFGIFSLLFEIISAYGTVGLSLSVGVDQSLSVKFTTVSKLVIIAMMIRGRHRGLPYSLDRAIMLPSNKMQRRDRVQEHHALQREKTTDSFLNRRSSSSGFGLNRLRTAITRTAGAYRRNSLFPAPTRLEAEEVEMGNMPRERSI